MGSRLETGTYLILFNNQALINYIFTQARFNRLISTISSYRIVIVESS